jgi:squalene-associated FAD-dependent desaturase
MERQALDDVSFYEWLRANHQSERAIRNFWNLVVLPTLNDDVRLVSAELALMIFQVGFLDEPNSPNIGYSTVGLSSLLSQAAQRYIKDKGGSIIFGQKVERIMYDDGRINGIAFDNGEVLTADLYVSAVPHHDLPALLPNELQRSQFFSGVQKLRTSPIVNVHLWYDRAVADFDFAAFLDNDVQWIFNKGAILGIEGSGYLDVSLSGACEHIDLPANEIAARVAKAVEQLLPRTQRARLLRHLVIKQHNATFAAAPGCGALRPFSHTPIANFFLAGDWTNTGWPATMESAVRSGIACAQAIDSIKISNKVMEVKA